LLNSQGDESVNMEPSTELVNIESALALTSEFVELDSLKKYAMLKVNSKKLAG